MSVEVRSTLYDVQGAQCAVRANCSVLSCEELGTSHGTPGRGTWLGTSSCATCVRIQYEIRATGRDRPHAASRVPGKQTVSERGLPALNGGSTPLHAR
jgi:hypothetical protein